MPLTIIKYKAADLKIDQFKSIYDDPMHAHTAITNMLTAERLKDKEGYDMYHMTFNSPISILLANRSYFICYYKSHLDDGTLKIINSSLGNEDYETNSK